MASGSEDLGIKIGSKDEAMWKQVADNLKAQIAGMEKELTINKAFLGLAETNQAKEKKKFWKR